MDGNVSALAVSGTDLYAGGWFGMAGKVVASNIAKWNGGAWSALGSGLDEYGVYALTASGTDLFVGGWFSKAGGVTAGNIAKWNGSAWSALGRGMDSPVTALAVSGTILYAGGSFTAAGGLAANRVAAWNGSGWSALGSGVGAAFEAGSPSVSALAVDGLGHLFVGGQFSLAGTNVSPFIAQANIGEAVRGGRLDSLAYSPATGFGWTFRDATIGQPYRIQTSSSLEAGTWTDFTNFVYERPTVMNDRSVAAGVRRFYRAISP